MQRKEIVRDLISSLALLPFPFVLAVLKLVESGTWENAWDALRGKYILFGIPGHPWREFLSFVVPFVLLSILFAWLATIVAQRIGPRPQRLIVYAFFNMVAAISFGLAMEAALTAPFWFVDVLVIGSVGSSPFFWVSVAVGFVFLFAKGYRA